MKVIPTEHPEVLILEPRIFEDGRGAFFESYNETVFRTAGIPDRFVQDNQSISKEHVLRGLHYQIRQPQGKLVRALRGEIFDVAVDCRKSSRRFRQAVCMRVSAENRRMIWIPAGFAHGFLVVSDQAEVLYKTTDFYAPEHERTLLWNDPELSIPWPISNPLLSEKDQRGLTISTAEIFE